MAMCTEKAIARSFWLTGGGSTGQVGAKRRERWLRRDFAHWRSISAVRGGREGVAESRDRKTRGDSTSWALSNIFGRQVRFPLAWWVQAWEETMLPKRRRWSLPQLTGWCCWLRAPTRPS